MVHPTKLQNLNLTIVQPQTCLVRAKGVFVDISNLVDQQSSTACKCLSARICDTFCYGAKPVLMVFRYSSLATSKNIVPLARNVQEQRSIAQVME